MFFCAIELYDSYDTTLELIAFILFPDSEIKMPSKTLNKEGQTY